MKWISDFIDLILPRHCIICGEVLSGSERDICIDCMYRMPKIEQANREEIEKVFWGKIEIRRATSYMYYRKGATYANLFHHLKYRNHPEVGERLAHLAAKELEESGFFYGIDAIIPLPLSKKKKRKRGYNQCDYIADGISRATGIEIIRNSVVRGKANESQTHKSREERWQNVEGIFSLTRPEAIEGKHILLVDDILTTGATLCSCAKAIQDGCDCTISIFTIGYSHDGI